MNLNIFILSIFYWLCYYSFPNFSSALHPQPASIPPDLSSCPWLVHTSSLSSLFPIPFFTSPHLFNACQLCFLFPVPFPLYSSFLPSHWKTSTWCPFLWFCSCSSCLLSFLFHSLCFILGSFVDSREFVVILLFIFFIFFFLDKSL